MDMKIPPSALFSAVLMATTIGAMAIPTINVNVMNFPLDEQGNLRVAQMNQEPNITANVRQSYYQWCALQPINGSSSWEIDTDTSGYSKVFIMFWSPSNVGVSVEFDVTYKELMFATWFENFTIGGGEYITRTYEVKGTLLHISIRNGGWGQVTVGVGIYMTT